MTRPSIDRPAEGFWAQLSVFCFLALVFFLVVVA